MEGGVIYRNWIIEHHHHPVTGIAFKRAAILVYDFTYRRMVFTQQGHHVFGIRTFREPGKAAQIAEQRGYFATVAFELLLAPDATIRSATCGGKKRRSLLMRSISLTWSVTRCSSCWFSLLRSLSSRAFSIAITAWAAKFHQLDLPFSEGPHLPTIQ